PSDCSHFAALASAAIEAIAAVRLESRDADSMWHLELFEDFAGTRIDSPQIALVAFPRRMPQLAVNPGHAGDKAVRIDRAKNRAGFGIDLMDLPIAILPDPQRSFGPREPRISAASGRRDRGDHATGLRIDLLDSVLGELKQVLAVERGSGMRGHVD